LSIAVGEMGMSVESFLMLTPDQFADAYEVFRNRIKAEAEHSEQLAWNVARWQVWRTMCPPQGKKQLSVMDLLPLPGDEVIKQEKAKKIIPSTEDRFRKLAEKWK